MAVIAVDIAGRPYEVRVGAGLLAELVPNCRGLLRKREVPVVTDANVHAAWGEVVDAALRDVGHEPHWRVLPAGEASKSWAELSATVDWLLDLGVERGDHVLALGGGVIGDLTGFAASILKRGCRFIQLPTTLLAQVDSSVGGKTAINTRAGKNLVGAFHQPALVLADLATLDTLPPRELRAGYAEVIKYGLIGDVDFFAWCEANGAQLLAGDAALREYAVARSVAHKAKIVAEDETGLSDRLLHGEAVALGMVLAARYSVRRGLMPRAEADRIARHLAAVDMVGELAELKLSCDGGTLTAHMLHDKKMDAGTLPFLLMKAVGETFLAKDVELADVAEFLDEELAR